MEYRLEIYPAIELNNCKKKVYEFSSFKELKAASNTASILLLFIQDELKAMQDYSNMFNEYILINGEWEDIEVHLCTVTETPVQICPCSDCVELSTLDP